MRTRSAAAPELRFPCRASTPQPGPGLSNPAPQVKREMVFIMSPTIQHPNIVRGIATFEDPTAFYLVQVSRAPLFIAFPLPSVYY